LNDDLTAWLKKLWDDRIFLREIQLHVAGALSNYSFKPSVKRAGMELPTFLKERFDGCQGQTELQDHKLERI
jgi:hypothetical protein